MYKLSVNIGRNLLLLTVIESEFFLNCLFCRILQTLCRKLRLPETFNFSHLAHLTPGFVGADLMALCREAAVCAVHRVLMRRQEQQRTEPETGGLPSDGEQGRSLGAEPPSETQVGAPQFFLSYLVLMPGTQAHLVLPQSVRSSCQGIGTHVTLGKLVSCKSFM